MRTRACLPQVGITALLILGATASCGHRSGETPAQGPQASPPAPGGTTATAPAALPPALAPTPAIPQVMEIPARSNLSVLPSRALATDRDHAGDTWQGTLAKPVMVNGKVAWAEGTPVKGVVTASAPAGRLNGGKGGLGINLTDVGGIPVQAGQHLVTGGKRSGRNAKFIGGGAALGALLGAVTGRGNKGERALGGAAVGAAAGTGVAAGTADTVLRIPAGVPVTFSLSQPAKVTLP